MAPVISFFKPSQISTIAPPQFTYGSISVVIWLSRLFSLGPSFLFPLNYISSAYLAPVCVYQ